MQQRLYTTASALKKRRLRPGLAPENEGDNVLPPKARDLPLDHEISYRRRRMVLPLCRFGSDGLRGEEGHGFHINPSINAAAVIGDCSPESSVIISTTAA